MRWRGESGLVRVLIQASSVRVERSRDTCACPSTSLGTNGGWGVALALLLAGCAGDLHRAYPDTPVKIGRPYAAAGRVWVPADDPRYDTIGEASWYGSYEQGRPTASGERFDKRRVSAAHPTLPLPSYVEVTRLDTGERMIVRINDRGPYARDRIIDLSREAARQLGIEQAGHALVRVRRVQPTRRQADALRRGYPVMLARTAPTASPLGTGPAPQPPPVMPQAPAAPPIATPPVVAAPVPALPPVTPHHHNLAAMPMAPALRIVIATLDDPDAADALASALADEGARVEAQGGGYRIVTGPYPDADAQAAALARLRARGYGGAVAFDAPISIHDPNGPDHP